MIRESFEVCGVKCYFKWATFFTTIGVSAVGIATYFLGENRGVMSLNAFTLLLVLLALVGAGIGSFAVLHAYRRKEKALKELFELQKRTEGILLAVPDIIMQVDNQKCYTWANEEGYAFFGKDVLGKEAAHFFEGEQETYSMVHPLMSGEKDAVYIESWQKRSDGESRLLAWWCRNLKDENGLVVGAVSTARDITEEFRREERLLMQSYIIDVIQDSIMMHDLQGRFVYLNENAWKERGYTHDELMAMSVKELDAPQTQATHEQIMQGAIEQIRREGALKIEVEHMCKNGKLLPVEVYAKLINLNEQEYVLSSVRNISDRKIIQQALEDSEKKYRSLVEHSMIGVYRSDTFGKIHYVNPALAKIFGFESPNDLIGTQSFMRYKNIKDREKIVEWLKKDSYFTTYEMELLDRNGNPIPVMVSASMEGEMISGMIVDMRAIKESRKEVEKLSKAIEQIDDIVYITDKSGNITYINNAYTQHLGYSKEEAIGKNSRLAKSGVHDKAFYTQMWKTILSGNVYRNTVVNRKKNGDIYYEKKTITPLKDPEDNIVGFVSTGKDVTEETMLNQEIERMASIDNLTGIYNRHKFEEIFALESERSRRFKQPLSLILVDIDHFKNVNDIYGHDVGDDILRQITQIIGSHIRKIDILARWGGEEFLVLCPNTALEDTKILAEKLRVSVEEYNFPFVGALTISLGVSEFTDEDAFVNLFKRVDQALYSAKEKGRNRVGFLK